MDDRTTTVIVGASVAGIRAAAALRNVDPDRHIILIDGEDEFPYDKPPLSKAVLTSAVVPSVALPDLDRSDIDHRRATDAVGIVARTSTLALSDGTIIRYDSAILATGSAPRRLPMLEGMPGVHYLRTLADALALRAALRRRPRVVVIGGGFIGCEVASSAREYGLEVTIVEAGPRLAARVLPAPVSHMLQELHGNHGVVVRCGAGVREATYDKTRETIQLGLDDGSTLAAELVVVGIGTEPSTSWAAGCAVPIGDGFLCGPDLRVDGADNLYAIGDVSRWLNPRYGRSMRVEHWTNAREHAAIAAHNITHPDAPRYATAVPFVWSDQHGARIQHVGDQNLSAVEIHTTRRPDSGRLFTYFRDGVLVGATAFNAQAALAKIRRQLLGQTRPAIPAATGPKYERGRA
ncbi:FAD-dependent oxidoreductase [Nocardia gamkensis]|uniref:NAD(P)/FAD-dependent oxidoreductase n=1 Tax=Nocardia gamkensis TaxID=352869 RepID=UPI0033CAA7DB